MYWFPFFEYDANHHLALKPIAETRIFGVLQRIALAYCAASLLIYFLNPKLPPLFALLYLLPTGQ